MTTTYLSYQFPIFETSAAALRGTTKTSLYYISFFYLYIICQLDDIICLFNYVILDFFDFIFA